RPKAWDGLRGYVATGDADDHGRLSPVPITYADRPSRADLEADPNDVGFARMASAEKVFEVTEESSKHVYSTGFAFLRPDRSRLDSKYLRHWLRTQEFQAAKDSHS